MHNLYAIFAKFLDICQEFGKIYVNEKGNVCRPSVIPRFSDLEVIALSLTAESIGIDSESYLFAKLADYRSKLPHLISRRQYNDRRKQTANLCNLIIEKIANHIDGGEEYFCLDSKPIEVCRTARGKRCKMGKGNYEKAPSFGYCASQGTYYYGYKLHAVCGLSGVIHSFDLTRASVHDIKYLQDVKYDYHDCSIFGDRGYISASMQLDLFETANIELLCPYRINQKVGNQRLCYLLKQEKELKPYSLRCVTNL